MKYGESCMKATKFSPRNFAIRNNRLQRDPPEIHYPKTHGTVISVSYTLRSPPFAAVPFIFHSSSRRPFRSCHLCLVLIRLAETIPGGTRDHSIATSKARRFSLILSAVRVSHIKDARCGEGTQTGVQRTRPKDEKRRNSIALEERKRPRFEAQHGREREWKRTRGARKGGIDRLKEEKRNLKSCESLTFVIEFSRLAIVVLSPLYILFRQPTASSLSHLDLDLFLSLFSPSASTSCHILRFYDESCPCTASRRANSNVALDKLLISGMLARR